MRRTFGLFDTHQPLCNLVIFVGGNKNAHLELMLAVVA